MAGLLDGLRQLPDRLLRGARRRAALRVLARAGQPPRSVLVICNGNMFRSPFAAALLRRSMDLAGLHGVSVESAGFAVPGRPAPPHAVQAAARRGIDLTYHRSQLLTPELVRAADLIVVMEEPQRRSVCERFGRAGEDVLLLGDMDPQRGTSREIEDPVEQAPAVCDRVYTRIEGCVGELVRALKHPGGRYGEG